MLQKLSSREITEWMAYATLDPIGNERLDINAGHIAATIANANRDPRRRKKAFTHKDFTLQFFHEPKSPHAVWDAIDAAFTTLENKQWPQ